MTENELRNLYVSTAEKYLGVAEGSIEHAQIVNIYNSHTPLARGYHLKYWDAWCAGFVSAMAIEAGLTDIIPTEVGTDHLMWLAQDMGIWEEDDGYIPASGDIILLDWDDSGIGDNHNSTSHVGIVVACDGNTIKTIEGNMGNKVNNRWIAVDGQYIRGFITPDYKSISEEDEDMIKWHTVEECPDWAKPTIKELVDRGLLKGDENGDLRLTETMVRILVINDRAGLYD